MQSAGGKAKKRPQDLKPKVIFALSVVIWAGLAMVASQNLVALVMRMLLGNAIGQPSWTLVFYILSYGLTLGLVIWLPPKALAAYHKRRPKASSAVKASDFETNIDNLGLQPWPGFVDLGLVPIAYIIYLILANGLQAFMQLFPWFDADQAQNVGFGYFITGWEQVAAVIAIVFIAPIAEEIIMRGWVYGKLRSKLGVVISCLLTSVLFGALHGQWNVAVTTFVLSLILCSLREITGTIWSGILLHMLVNGIAFYILYIGFY